MITLLVTIPNFTKIDWQMLLDEALAKTSFALEQKPTIVKDHLVSLSSNESFCGVNILMQTNGLKLLLPSLPSANDLSLFKTLLQLCSLHPKVNFSSDLLAEKFLKNDTESLLKEIWNETAQLEVVEISLQHHREVNLKKWSRQLEVIDAENLLVLINRVKKATEVEIFVVDEKKSLIWDGSETWIPNSVEQILFSQKYFKGSICGEIETTKISEILQGKILWGLNGFVLPNGAQLSKEEIVKINQNLLHYEKKAVIQKLEKLSIEIGVLQDISYSMTKALFSGKPLTKVSDHYMKNGISKAQLEVAAMAVSCILEIAATSKNRESMEQMQGKLKTKCKLTAEAASAVTQGFFKAAAQTKVKKFKINWLKLSIVCFSIATILWFIFK